MITEFLIGLLVGFTALVAGGWAAAVGYLIADSLFGCIWSPWEGEAD